mmetsp:Transcript_205/g.551  ORF Transcript_205/g.551 Transcript_205/m.551 type:complete len:257 (-) Transcript_205:307-1077(-)
MELRPTCRIVCFLALVLQPCFGFVNTLKIERFARRDVAPVRELRMIRRGSVQQGLLKNKQRVSVGAQAEIMKQADAKNNLNSAGGDMITQSEFEAWQNAERERGLVQYGKLKERFLSNTMYMSGAIVVYFLVNGVSFVDLLASVLGGISSILYAYKLAQDIESISPDDPTPMLELKDAQGTAAWIVKILTGYRYSFNSRLLIPLGLALALVALDSFVLPIPLSARGTAFGGFLAYNAALFGSVFDSLVPPPSVSSD